MVDLLTQNQYNLGMKTNHAILKNEALNTINRVLSDAGYSVRIVGGAVRDMLQGKNPKDIDIATDAQPHVVAAAFEVEGIEVVETGLQHGTVTVVIDHVGYEITTLRSDIATDGRHAEVQFHADWKLDADRRDLTINAMSMDFEGNVFDYHNGIEDLKNGRIVFVGNPTQRIREDYLRILRYFRFAARLQHEPVFHTNQMDAIEENREGLKNISVERVWAEMQKLVVAPQAFKALTSMLSVGVLNVIGMNVPTFKKFLNTQSDNPVTKMVALIGKNMVQLSVDWKMSSDEMKLAAFLCEWQNKEMSVKDWQRLVAVKRVNFMWVEELAKLKNFNLGCNEIKNAQSAVFPVNGNDVMAKGMKGQAVGESLTKMKEVWLDSQFVMSKEELLGIC